MQALSIILVHLDEYAGRVIGQRHWIVLLEIDSHHIAVPLDASAEVARVKRHLRLSWVLLEGLIAAHCEILAPADVRYDD